MMPGWAPSIPASPCAVGVDGHTVVELAGVLTEVPDVAPVVRRVPVEGVLDGLAVDGDGVADDEGAHAHDLAGLAGDLYDGALDAVRGPRLIDPPHAAPQREVGVIHRVAKVAGSIGVPSAPIPVIVESGGLLVGVVEAPSQPPSAASR